MAYKEMGKFATDRTTAFETAENKRKPWTFWDKVTFKGATKEVVIEGGVLTGEVVPTQGYFFGGTVDFLSSGNFDPDSYPGLRAVRFLVSGAGGAGGGAAITGSGNASCGGGGAGGTYAESAILTVAAVLAIDDPVEITIGVAGTHNSGAAGSAGGATVVGPSGTPIVSCPGGGGGAILAAGSTVSGADGGASGGAATGSSVAFFAQGSQGDHGMRLSGTAAQGGRGGSGGFGNGAGSRWASGAGEAASGRGRGGGSGGAVNGQNQGGARSGGIASDGRVIVELYY